MRLKYSLLHPTIFLLIFLFIFSILNAQKIVNDYSAQWKKVEDFQKKGLTKSAIDEVNIIYAIAKKNVNEPQIIKSLLFKINLKQNIEEEASAKNIDSLELEIISAKEPARSILQSITAQLYWMYFQQNRYKFYQRTNTVNFEKKDIATWTSDDLHKRISQLYLASINHEILLKQTKLEPFDAIIEKGNVRSLRPTLYDFLAHRALDYFTNDERNITRPAYAFEIKDSMAFAPANEFINANFLTKDSSSLQQKALIIFQKLLSFHQRDKNPDAMIDADLERINFVNQYAVIENKDELYINALRHLSERYAANPLAVQASFLIAQKTYNEAIESKRNKDSSIYTIAKAKEILDTLINKFPKSEGSINAQNLLKTILHPSLNLTTEKINVPSQPFRTLVTYQNLDKISLKIIALTPQLKQGLQKDYNNDKVFEKLNSLKTVRSWDQNLPKNNDYFLHSVEIKIDPLPLGEYALIASVDRNFTLDKNPLALQYFYVSDISFVNSGLQYFVLNRTTGQPLSGANIQVWNQQYDYKSRDSRLIKQAKFTTDKNGYFKLTEIKNNPNSSADIRLDITYKNDRLFLDDYQYVYYNNYNNITDKKYENQKASDEENAKVFLFTDRSIYRPGQMVYFKGIGVTKDFTTKKSILLQSKDPLGIIFFDANKQKIDSVKVLLNEFGSFNGKFKIPENNLNGEFSVNVNNIQNSEVSFSVEEYKRPEFYTEFEKAKKNYRVNDSVEITGFAKAYAGNNIDGAKVSYRVTRIARFLYPWMFWRKGFPQIGPLELAHGEITTDENGRFVIAFKAIPDLNLDPKTDPVFDYKIEADVTDINGETRSGEIIIPVGYKALNLQIIFPHGDVMDKDSLKNILITSKNLSGEFQPVNANVKIYKLQSPERLVRERLWDEPDQFIFTKNQYIQYFSHDEYKDETKKESWAKGELIFEKTDSVLPDHQFSILNTQFSQGWYILEATAKDQYGQEVKNVKYFQVFDTKSSSLPASTYVWNYAGKKSFQPGETATIITGTSAKNVFLIQEINKQKISEYDKQNQENKSISRNYYTLNNKRAFDFSVADGDRGGFGVNQFFVKDNRFYAIANSINVPWSNKELSISFDTYRDKTMPGSEENWKVKITGNKGEKVAAEMLASMYDASLDQFKMQSWSNLQSIFPKYSGYNFWQGRQNFTPINSIEIYWSEKYIQPKEKKYDALKYLPQYQSFQNGIVSRNATMDIALPAPQMMRKESNVEFAPPKIVPDEEKIAATDTTAIVGESLQNDRSLIDQSQIQIRKNFNETVFFFPELRTDKDGNIEFSFTMPEALTQWKLMTLAHTKDMASGYAEKNVITQKELMIQPNPPRFFREGDQLIFSAKIVNMSGKEVSGQAQLQLLNASTMNPIDEWFQNNNAVKNFTASAGQSTVVNFSIKIPDHFNNAVVYRIVAKAENMSDGEEAAIPVITNRSLVTESMPLPMRGTGSRDFKFEKIINQKSETLTNYGLMVEYATNPAWYVVQALPYLIEYPYESADQNFNRFYANALAQKIANSSPKIKAIFEKWKTIDSSALLSNLQKNEELKSVLLQETPWVLQAQNEEQQKKNIALLFDKERMNSQLQSALNKLKEMQSPNGGFVWFKGGPDNRYITQYIVSGIGHLKKLNAYPKEQQNELNTILGKAISYIDKTVQEEYEHLLKSKKDLSKNNLSNLSIQYLYMRSFFPDYPFANGASAKKYLIDQAKKYWFSQSKFMQGLIALSLYRSGDQLTPKKILKSLKENSINNEEMGMYWKEWDRKGYWWYEAPIESQSLMIEAFSEIENDAGTISDLKTWLLKNKQTNNWGTTKATADACYALLLQGTDWLTEEKNVVIKLGNTIFNSKDEKEETATGYFKRKIDGEKIKPEMGNIKVTVSNTINQSKNENQDASWGAVYWQYFENLDKINFSETPLQLSKKLFIEKKSDKGPILFPVNNGDHLKVGDKIKVRIELRVDRDMEFVQMKDMRASCMEPTNVISEYKYQGGLGYYESTKDASTHFFFDYLNKGTYVFEYPMFVTHAGNFSNGITTIQSMYAPEFTAHSEGVRVIVE